MRYIWTYADGVYAAIDNNSRTLATIRKSAGVNAPAGWRITISVGGVSVNADGVQTRDAAKALTPRLLAALMPL